MGFVILSYLKWLPLTQSAFKNIQAFFLGFFVVVVFFMFICCEINILLFSMLMSLKDFYRQFNVFVTVSQKIPVDILAEVDHQSR